MTKRKFILPNQWNITSQGLLASGVVLFKNIAFSVTRMWSSTLNVIKIVNACTLWFQLEDMFQLIVTPQGIEKVMIQLKDTPSKVYAIGAELFLPKVPLEVLQNWVLIQLIVTPHILGKVQGQIKEVCRLIEPCLLIGTREYSQLTTQ